MTPEDVLASIATGRVIAILRGVRTPVRAAEIASVLHDAGITAVEVTMNSPAALESVGLIATRLRGAVAVGAGTVLTVNDVGAAAAAGAQFIVSPECSSRVVAAAVSRGLVSIPGCFTPTEIGAALDAGAHAVKLFPASSLGPGFVKAMHGPRRGLRMVPTGGVNAGNAREWLDAGAWALGVGSELVGEDVDVSGLDGLRERARALVAAVRSAERKVTT